MACIGSARGTGPSRLELDSALVERKRILFACFAALSLCVEIPTRAVEEASFVSF